MAFEQPALFEFLCHLAIERCKSAHEILCLSVLLVECFFLNTLSAFQKFLFSMPKIHRLHIHI